MSNPATPRRRFLRHSMPVAEFITLRQACGLTQQEAGEVLGAAHRTVQHWEGGRNAIPKSASDALKDLDDLIRAKATEVLEPLARQKRGTVPPVELLRYRTSEPYADAPEPFGGLPFAAHEAMLWRVMDGLSRLGIRYAISWAENVRPTDDQAFALEVAPRPPSM